MKAITALALAAVTVVTVSCAKHSAAPGGDKGGIEMQSKVTGSGETVVLVGGGLTGWLSWEPHTKRLETTRKVIRLQPLNVQWGLENKPLPDDYSVKTESRALGRALDAAGVKEPVDLVAWSYGALATLDFALDNPGRVRTATLIEPPAFWALRANGALSSDALAAEKELAPLHGDISEQQLEQFLQTAGFAQPGKSVREFPQWPVWNQHRQALRNSPAVLDYRDDLARLRAFNKPVLLFKGTGSSKWLHEALDVLAKNLPNAKVIELPAGHAPQIVSMDRFLAATAEFQAAAKPASPGTR
jgi:pimeloyl-ACP methyl ester carboxylesterase